MFLHRRGDPHINHHRTLLHEIRRDGVDAIFENIYENFRDVDLIYVSFDVDVFDMSYAPGTGSSEPTGMSPNELFPKLREFAATKNVVGIDIVVRRRTRSAESAAAARRDT